ncbi:retrovirus-related pol polyprotein from transposon TNT 1-94 [Tanacetum coccineum]
MGTKLLKSCEPVPCGHECRSETSPTFDQERTVFLDFSGKLVRSGCTTALDVVPWEIDDESGLKEVEPPREGQRSNAQVVQAVEAWKYSDFLCHNYVLNGLVDSLYKVYCKTMTAKELWESLESKYKTEDAGTKKFVVAHFLDYKMVDSKNVTSQVQDLQVLLHDIHAKGMALSETFQVATITEKLPPSWVEFKNYLKHKRKKMSVEDLVVRLCIKEDNKLAQKNTYTPDSVKANMVEHAGSSSKSNSKAKGKGNGKNDKKSKRKAEYLAPKVGIANMVNDNMDMISMVSDVIAMISEVNLIAVGNGEKLYMGNSATADIKGEGDCPKNLGALSGRAPRTCQDSALKMTSEKELKLTNVLYVPEIRKNLVKDKVIDKFVVYKTEAENQFGRKIKVVRSDRGGEYVSPFADLCAKHEIRHEFTIPYSPQQNGIAERKNRTWK